jgi:glycosyltransferase involved in cell wall biosynthesis
MNSNMPQKVVVVISGINYSLGFDWFAQYIDKSKFEIHFVFLNSIEPELARILKERGFNTSYIHYKSKKHIVLTVWKLLWLFTSVKPAIVHAHLFDASICSLPVAKFMGIKKRIYTRHHSTFHHQYFPNMVKYDRFINFCSTHIVAISENVKNVLIKQEGVSEYKIHLIHHGFDQTLFDFNNELLKSTLKTKYKLTSNDPIIGVVSRYTKWKGIQFIIPAFKALLLEFPNAKLVLANASGDYKQHIQLMLSELPSNSYCEIEFEKDIFALYSTFNIFVHVPIDANSEAFGQTYIESLMSGIPSVFTLSGIANEFIVHDYNASVVPFQDSTAIYNAFIKILMNKDFKNRIVQNGLISVNENFKLVTMINKIEKLYEA